MNLANPVAGVIHPFEWKRPAGNRDFRVTAKFHAIDESHPTPHTGLDIGDGDPDADAVMAAAPGKVTLTRALDGVVEVSHSPTFRTVYAHLRQPFEVKTGQMLATGQVLGHIGQTGTSVPHLHFEAKEPVRGQWRYDAGHRDPWPLLRQNQLPDTALPEDDVDASTFIPAVICDVASGGTLYGDAKRQTVRSRTWGGGAGIPFYAGQSLPDGLAALRLSSGGGSDPYIGYIGTDKVSNVRLPGDALDNKLRGARTAVDGAAQAIAAAQRSLA